MNQPARNLDSRVLDERLCASIKMRNPYLGTRALARGSLHPKRGRENLNSPIQGCWEGDPVQGCYEGAFVLGIVCMQLGFSPQDDW